MIESEGSWGKGTLMGGARGFSWECSILSGEHHFFALRSVGCGSPEYSAEFMTAQFVFPNISLIFYAAKIIRLR